MVRERKRRILPSSDESEMESSQSSEESSDAIEEILSSGEQYDVDERILCSHNGQFYDAKILKVETDQDEHTFYTVHYMGWNAAHDEVISEDVIDVRFRQLNPPSKKRKEKDEVPKGKEKKKSPLKPNPEEPKEVTPLEEKIIPQAFEFPKQLASIWKSDFEAIQKNKSPKIPTRFTTEKIVNEYKKNMQVVAEGYGVPRNSTIMKILTADAILELFDLSLRSMILYKKEWATYDDLKQGMMAQGIHSFVPRKHYGFAHLIRFCIKSDEILAKLEMTPEDRIQIGVNVQHFTDFLKSKIDEYYDIEKDYQ